MRKLTIVFLMGLLLLSTQAGCALADKSAQPEPALQADSGENSDASAKAGDAVQAGETVQADEDTRPEDMALDSRGVRKDKDTPAKPIEMIGTSGRDGSQDPSVQEQPE